MTIINLRPVIEIKGNEITVLPALWAFPFPDADLSALKGEVISVLEEDLRLEILGYAGVYGNKIIAILRDRAFLSGNAKITVEKFNDHSVMAQVGGDPSVLGVEWTAAGSVTLDYDDPALVSLLRVRYIGDYLPADKVAKRLTTSQARWIRENNRKWVRVIDYSYAYGMDSLDRVVRVRPPESAYQLYSIRIHPEEDIINTWKACIRKAPDAGLDFRTFVWADIVSVCI